MAKITGSIDIDQRLLELAGDGDVRIRLQPDIYDARHHQYGSWRNLVWSVTLSGVDEARELREGLTDFFRVFGAGESDKVVLLAGLKELAGRLS